jgi:PAS domain-containing protein
VEELCPDEKVLPSEFYNEWVRPQALRRGLNGVLFNEGSLAGSIGAIRARAGRPFCVDDKRFLRALMPHLQRAVRLRRLIADLEVLATRTADALDHWTTAVFLVGPDARVILANRTAVDLLGQRDGLLAEHGILKAAHSKDTVTLHSGNRICSSPIARSDRMYRRFFTLDEQMGVLLGSSLSPRPHLNSIVKARFTWMGKPTGEKSPN